MFLVVYKELAYRVKLKLHVGVLQLDQLSNCRGIVRLYSFTWEDTR